MFQVDSLANDEAQLSCQIAGYKTSLLIDSGSSVNTVAPKVFNKMLSIKEVLSTMMNIEIDPDKLLMAYAGSKPLKVLRAFTAALFISDDRPVGAERFYVVEGATQSLLGRKSAIAHRVLRLGINVPISNEGVNLEEPDEWSSLNTLSEGEKFPKINIEPVKLYMDGSVQAKRMTYTHIDSGWREEARRRVKRWLEADIIEKLTKDMPFEHCSAMLAVPKGVNDFRLVVDLRNPNKAVIREPHKMPTLDFITAQLNGAIRFSTVDLEQAYLQVELDESSRHITNFYDGENYYRFKRMPFGLCNAPDIFQRIMEEMLTGCKGVVIYLDDLLMFGKTQQEHDKNLRRVLRRLKRFNVKLNDKKCTLNQSECTFLGFRFNSSGYSVTDDRIKAIRNFRKPETLAEIRSFLGLMNFVDKFVLLRADKTYLMQSMLREKVFEWSVEVDNEFEFMKNEALKAIRNLGFFDANDRIELIVDASPVGLGAVLVQYDSNDKPRIIACASKALSGPESRYAQTQREALAVVWATERFRFYLMGRSFTILTDGEANEFIFNTEHRLGRRAVSRAEAWALRLLPYTFTIRRVKGSENIADVFSRLISASQVDDPFPDAVEDHIMLTTVEDSLTLTWDEIVAHSANDATLMEVKESLTSGEWSEGTEKFRAVSRELFFISGVLVFRDKFVVPGNLQAKALRLAHRGHFGASSMKKSLRKSLWWPGINREVENKVAKCKICLQLARSERPVPLVSRVLPEAAMDIIQIDFLYIPRCGSEEFLVVTDTFSRALWVIEMKKTNAEVTNQALRDIFMIWGRPNIIQSDNGPPFQSQSFTNEWAEQGVHHRTVVPYAPFMNGMVERRNQGVLRTLKAAKLEGRDWRTALNNYVCDYNHEIPHSATGFTPFELLAGRKFRGFFPSLGRLSQEGAVKDGPIRDDIVEEDARSKLKSTQYTDKRNGAKESPIRVGDWVLLVDKGKQHNKMHGCFSREFFQVIHREGPKLIVKNVDGVQYTRWVSDAKLVPDSRWKAFDSNGQTHEGDSLFTRWDLPEGTTIEVAPEEGSRESPTVAEEKIDDCIEETEYGGEGTRQSEEPEEDTPLVGKENVGDGKGSDSSSADGPIQEPLDESLPQEEVPSSELSEDREKRIRSEKKQRSEAAIKRRLEERGKFEQRARSQRLRVCPARFDDYRLYNVFG